MGKGFNMQGKQGKSPALGRYLALVAVGISAIFAAVAGPAAADPGASVPLNSVGQPVWNGTGGGSNLGSPVYNAGDVNGDGISDMVARQSTPDPGGWVLFTDPAFGPAQNLSDLPPSKGYRMRVAGASPFIYAVGDQNGDDVPDFVVVDTGDVRVVYGVDDPQADLPKCDPMGVPQTRCLDVANPQDINGNRLGYKIESGDVGDGFAGQGLTSGDFSGDSKRELAISAFSANSGVGAVYVIRNNLGDTCPVTPGLCTVTLSSQSAPAVVRFNGPGPGANFGLSTANGGDINADGKDDLLAGTIAGALPASVYTIYGKTRETSPVGVDTLPAADGFTYTGAAGTLFFNPASIGDANGDGRMDVGAMMTNPGAGGVVLTTAYTPENPTSPVPLYIPTAGEGYVVGPLSLDRFNNISKISALGDLNSDGLDDLTVGGPTSTVGGLANAGWAMIMFGQDTDVVSPTTLGPDFPLSRGLALVGTQAQQRVGEGIAPMGDVDQDGIPDFAVSTRDATNAGVIYLVRGKNLVAGASTGIAGSITEDGGTITGSASPNGRESEAHFEWGKTTEYGEETEVDEVGKGYGNVSLETEISGLEPETTYHYRTVVSNALGLTAYGPDRTFTTDEVPKTPCEIDPTAKGCDGYCPAHPTEKVCQPDEPTFAKLSSLIVGQKQVAVKRGGKSKVSVSVVNTGNAAANGVKICLAAPKKLVKVAKGCQTFTIADGGTASPKFTVNVKRKAKKGKKANLKFTASAEGLDTKTASSKLVVK